MLFLREVKEESKPAKPTRRSKGRLLCKQAQLDIVAERVRGMTEPEIITVVKTLREMGRI